MGTAPIPVIVAAAAKGNAADGSISRNSVDDYFASMESNLLLLLRATKISVTATSIVDALGNPITAATGTTKSNSDSNFNNHETITFAGNSNQYATNVGGIGIGTPPIAMPNSFSIVAGVRATSFATASSLYGDGLSSNGGVGIFCTNAGGLNAQVGSSVEVNAASVFPLNTTQVFWYSYDASTKIHRYGINNTATINQVVGSATRTSQGSSTVCYPFGYYSSGNSGHWAFHRWALFGKAYMNGAVASDDQQFSGLIATYKSYLGL